MLNDITYQISVFGDFSSISPDLNTVRTMMDNLADYEMVPSVVSEVNAPFPFLNHIPGAPTTNRLQMISNKLNMKVMFASNRVDVMKTLNASTDEKERDGYIDKIINVLCKSVPGPYSRLAVNTTSWVEDKNRELLKKFSPGIKGFDAPSEMDVRINKQDYISFGSACELANKIITVQKNLGQFVLGNEKHSFEDKFIILFDINTVAENASLRFSNDALKAFTLSAESFRRQVICEILGNEE